MKRICFALALCLYALTASAADTPEDIFWKSVSKTDLMEEYLLYTKQYPKGKYAGEAWRRIGQLEAKMDNKGQVKTDLDRTESNAEFQKQSSRSPSLTPNACASDGQCRSGLYCIQGKCTVQVESGGRCERNTECAGLTTRCIEGICGAGYGSYQSQLPSNQSHSVGVCTSDGQCSTGLYCIQGECLNQIRTGGRCERDTECGGLTSRCLFGRCK
jgi:hypothetical protein